MRDTRQVIDTYYQTSGRDWDAWLTLFDDNVVLVDGRIVRMADFHDTVPFQPYDSQDLS